MLFAPIAIFTYNRLDHTKKTIEALARNTFAKESDLYIFSDGPKANSAQQVKELRTYLYDVRDANNKKPKGATNTTHRQFNKVEIIESDTNKGLADSIISGVTSLVQKYGKVVVLEDDIITSPHFLTYMNDALRLYANDNKVMHISGYFIPSTAHQVRKHIEKLPATFFFNQTTCWGWATWDRAWKAFSSDTNMLVTAMDKRYPMIAHRPIFAPVHIQNTMSQLMANKKGAMKTWAAKWEASVTLANGLCLHPKYSLTQNRGFDGSGTRGDVTHMYDGPITNTYTPIERIELTESKDAVRASNAFLNLMRGTIINRIIRKIKRG